MTAPFFAGNRPSTVASVAAVIDEVVDLNEARMFPTKVLETPKDAEH